MIDEQSQTRLPACAPRTARDKARRAHLVGIAGAGMQAMADVLLGRGWRLSGSDLATGPVSHLARFGVRLFEGHAERQIPAQTQLLVHSDAVPPENPELRRAAELGIPALSYFQMVGRLMWGRHGLAVAGTHGKSTTTAMAAAVLVRSGRDPTVLCGARPLGQRSGGRAGDAKLVLAEACEYRANFLHLRPRQAVILGIEPDHFDCFHTPQQLEQAFTRFARSLPPDGLLLARHGCAATRRAAAEVSCRVETFGFDHGADWSVRGLSARRGRYGFEILHRHRRVCEVRLHVAGRHNVINALAAAALAWEKGVSAEEIARSLSGFRGLHRRLELLGSCRGVVLADDYAHHPTEVTATLKTIRQMYPGRRLWCVFQPHQVSRTAHLLDELAESLQNADKVAVAEIYCAREPSPHNGEVTAADLAAGIRSGGGQVAGVHRREEIARLLETDLAPGDVFVSIGAGDIRGISDGFIDRFREDRAA